MMDSTPLVYIALVSLPLAMTVSLIHWSLRLGITPTPSAPRVRQALARILPKSIQGEIHELGCGWGTLLPLLQNTYPEPGNRILAHERSPLPWCFSRLMAFLFYPAITVTRHDLFKTDLSGAGLIVCYLYPKAMTRLASQFKENLPPGCWIISHTFRLPGWLPVKTVTAGDLYKTPVYLYRVPCPSSSMVTPSSSSAVALTGLSDFSPPCP